MTPDVPSDLYAETHNGYGDPICTAYSVHDSVLALDKLRQYVHAPRKALHAGTLTTRPHLILYGAARSRALELLPPTLQFATPIERMGFERKTWDPTSAFNQHYQFFQGGQRAR